MASSSLLIKSQIEQGLETRRGQRRSYKQFIVRLEKLTASMEKFKSGNSDNWRDLSLSLLEVICKNGHLLRSSSCPWGNSGFNLMDYVGRRMNSQKGKKITAHLKKCLLCRLTAVLFKVTPLESRRVKVVLLGSSSKKIRKKGLTEEITSFKNKLQNKSDRLDKEIKELETKLITDFSPFSLKSEVA